MCSQKVSGVPWVIGSRRVSAGLGESGARWLKLAALFASPNGSGRKSGGQNGNDPLCLVDGLCC